MQYKVKAKDSQTDVRTDLQLVIEMDGRTER